MLKERDRLSRARDWLTIAAIVGGGVWALWTFIFEKWIEPSHAPQHLNIDARLQPAGIKDGLLAVQIYVSVKNQSSRTVYIPEGGAILTGLNIQHATPTPDIFAIEVNQKFAVRKGHEFSRSLAMTQKESVVIAACSFLTDWKLAPNEAASRSRVMYIDPARFDQVVLTVNVIEAENPAFDADFRVEEKDLLPVRYSADGKYVVLNPESKPSVTLTQADGAFQFTSAVVALSLWSQGVAKEQFEQHE